MAEAQNITLWAEKLWVLRNTLKDKEQLISAKTWLVFPECTWPSGTAIYLVTVKFRSNQASLPGMERASAVHCSPCSCANAPQSYLSNLLLLAVSLILLFHPLLLQPWPPHLHNCQNLLSLDPAWENPRRESTNLASDNPAGPTWHAV